MPGPVRERFEPPHFSRRSDGVHRTIGLKIMARNWTPLTEANRPTLPREVRDWIALETSMTARVGQTAGTAIDVDVLRQDRAPLFADERGFFSDPETATDVAPTGAQKGTVREVCLTSGATPLLVARTVFTSPTLEEHPTIRKLGNHALGSLLFADGPPRWSAREFIRLGPDAPLWPLVRQRHDGKVEGYWARRTLFELFGAPLLVTEIFLPELLVHPGVAAL